MSLKILGGNLKGISLKVPQTEKLRPTSVILRRKFFDRFQDWDGISFYDLFAGTGSMGVEALSRGAEKVILNEAHGKTFQSLKNSITQLKDKHNISDEKLFVHQGRAEKFFENFKGEFCDGSQTQCLFIDPPYELIKSYEYFYNSFTSEKELIDTFVVIEGDKKAKFDFNAWQESFPAGEYLWHGDHYLFMFWVGGSK